VTVVANSAGSHSQSSDQDGGDSGTASRVDRYVEVLRHAENILVSLLSEPHFPTDAAAHAPDACANASVSRPSKKNGPVIWLSITPHRKLNG
jgi:hypothetical protein